MGRIKLKKEEKKKKSAYFEEDEALSFVPTGCQLLDLVGGGGSPLGRIVNIIGDESTGKTLLAIEACANFVRQYSAGNIWYHEAEAAFDESYAKTLGMPIDKVDFVRRNLENFNTVEGLYTNLISAIDKCGKMPGLYILDSLDALTDEVENKQDIETVNVASKAKQMSRIFRKLVDKIEKSHILLIIISQKRARIGVKYGRQWSAACDGAMRYYASQRFLLSEVKKIEKVVRGEKKDTGIWVKAKNIKNKIGPPFRECLFPIYFSYGVDSNEASLTWLKSVTGLDGLGILDTKKKETSDILDKKIKRISKKMRDVHDAELEAKIMKKTEEVWNEIENEIAPKRSKYG